MANIEPFFVLLAFLLVGIVTGYSMFLVVRISEHQEKFEWSGALALITSLSGGGFLSYWSQPRNFAAYGIGFFIGFAIYWCLLQSRRVQRGSRAAAPVHGSTESLSEVAAAETGDESDLVRREFQAPLRLPEDQEQGYPENLIRRICDAGESIESRIKALLALRTHKDSAAITDTDSLWSDLQLGEFDLVALPAILRASPPRPPESLRLTTVKDLVDFTAGESG